MDDTGHGREINLGGGHQSLFPTGIIRRAPEFSASKQRIQAHRADQKNRQPFLEKKSCAQIHGPIMPDRICETKSFATAEGLSCRSLKQKAGATYRPGHAPSNRQVINYGCTRTRKNFFASVAGTG